MIKAILKGILKMIMSILNIVLLPINSLISNVFPSMSGAISRFNLLVDTYFTSPITWFFHILPPMFRTILGTWFTFVVAYYTIYYSYLAILKIWNVIQKIKFW